VNTTTVLTASPSPATAAQTVTLTAAVTAANGSSPAGSVQFEAGGTAIGSPVTVSGGMASTTATFAAAGTESLAALFIPECTAAYKSSTGSLSLTVRAAVPPSHGSIPLAVTVPAAGGFTLTVAPGTVTLTVSGSAAASALNPVTVTDDRNTQPGWSVLGQAHDFTGSGSAAGSTISGNQLGWVPTSTSLATGAALGPTVAPGSPGLGATAAVLASAAAGGGVGTSLLGANLTLAIPPPAAPGPYASTMAVTAITSLP
jgi:Bacterial Ig-like domain (group 3)